MTIITGSFSIDFNGVSIPFELEWKPVKNINVRIRPDGSVHVSANRNWGMDCVTDFITSRQDYILKELKRIEERKRYSMPSLKYISGETVRILGRGQRLKILVGETENVYSDGVFVFLTVTNKDDVTNKQKLLNGYLDQLRQETFSQIVNDVYPRFQKYGVEMPKICIREMNTRWGSCQPKRGIITLNSRLLCAPKSCIEYVVTHEFCHFRYPNHSKEFYNFLHVLMPDWEQRKLELERENG